mgnify:FL=1
MFEDYMKYKADEIELGIKINPLYALLGVKTDKLGSSGITEKKKYRQPTSAEVQGFFAGISQSGGFNFL